MFMLIEEGQQATNQNMQNVLSAMEQNGMGETMNVTRHLVD